MGGKLTRSGIVGSARFALGEDQMNQGYSREPQIENRGDYVTWYRIGGPRRFYHRATAIIPKNNRDFAREPYSLRVYFAGEENGSRSACVRLALQQAREILTAAGWIKPFKLTLGVLIGRTQRAVSS